MKIFKKRIVFFLLLFLAPLAVHAGDYTVEDQPKALQQAIVLDNCGTLKQKDNGYVYLDVNDAFISEILPLIETEGRLVPPRYFTSRKGIGAHISVMYENERIAHDIWQIAELGNKYSFNVQEIRSVKICTKGKMKKLWLLALEAPTLERLRENYGLPNKLHGHDLHITVGYQVPLSLNGSNEVEYFISYEDDLEEEAA
jgi:hypothetical protein